MNANQSQLALAINSANKNQSASALVVQTYCNSTLEQSPIDLSSDSNLETYQAQINSSLVKAQQHASYYLDTLQNQLIANISNIINYYNLQKSVSTTLPEGSTEQQWIEAISALMQESNNYGDIAKNLAADINLFYNELCQDSEDYSSILTNLNAAVDGDNGVLETELAQINSLDDKIRGEIAGIALSGVTMIGGFIALCLGIIASIAVPGSGTALVVSGGVALASGTGGEAASLAELFIDMNAKAALIVNESKLKDEVKMANAIHSTFYSLQSAVSGAITGSEQMANAWESLNSDLSNLSSDLSSGLQNADEVRTIFLTAANDEIQQVILDADNIKNQLDGVVVIKAQAGQTLEELVYSQI